MATVLTPPTWISVAVGNAVGPTFVPAPTPAPVLPPPEAQPEAVTIFTLYPCSFCNALTSAPASGKYAWHVCADKHCVAASKAQAERIYAGLFDSPETRAAALKWVRNRG